MEFNKIYQGDCLELMKDINDNSIDAVITDPPYGLEFMGKEWDKFEPNRQRWAGTERKFISDVFKEDEGYREKFDKIPLSIPPKNKKCKLCGHYFFSGTPCNCKTPQWEIDNSYVNYYQDFSFKWAIEALRVLKPGGYLLSFGGSRTYHRMACAIEDAGFEIRDMIEWIYGSGFPKSLNIGKQTNCEQWQGWGTALKPAHEPICMARKPLSEKTVAENVLKWGTGGINVDECRIEGKVSDNRWGGKTKWNGKARDGDNFLDNLTREKFIEEKKNREWNHPQGRFPTNLIHDGSGEVMAEFEKIGILKSGKHTDKEKNRKAIGMFAGGIATNDNWYGDSGTPARFFYCAKASKSERDMGCEGLEKISAPKYGSEKRLTVGGSKDIALPRSNNHPTVKPIKLMEYLIKLVTVKDAIVLDPFCGSGSTLIACRNLDRNYIGIDNEADYVEITEKRLNANTFRQEVLI